MSKKGSADKDEQHEVQKLRRSDRLKIKPKM